jgi:hypothetical protein
MVSVLSPGYQSSDWCLKELRDFFKAAQETGGIRIGNHSRLFKVIKTPMRLEEQPEKLRDLLGYEFYHDGREFRFDPNPEAERRYLAKLDDLARDIHLLLKHFRLLQEGSLRHSPGSLAKAVFLAMTTSDLNENRDLIRRELLDKGYEVLPDQTPPWNAKDLLEFLNRDLAHCCLSLHLIGSRYGFVPEGETRSIVWLQHEMARQRKRSGEFEHLLWMPSDLEAQEPSQRDFLAYLSEHLAKTNGFELLRTPRVESLKTFLIDKLGRQSTWKGAGHQARDLIRVYLICERKDIPVVEPIQEYLRQEGFAVDLPMREGDPNEISEDHRQTLKDCDALLIYYGSGSEGWFREKIRDARRAQALYRNKPFLARGIYFGPDPNDIKQSYADDEFVVSQNFGEFAPAALLAFLDRLRLGGAVSA